MGNPEEDSEGEQGDFGEDGEEELDDDEDDNNDRDDDDDDDDDGDDEESERPTKRSKIRKEDSGENDETLEDEDDDDEDDEEDDEDEESYREQYAKKKWKSSTHPATPVKALNPSSGVFNASDNDDTNKDMYVPLSIYGEHKRSVSSVKFAPSRLVKKDRPTAAICASSSADGYIKLWNVDGDTVASVAASSTKTECAAPLEPSVTCGGHTRGINDIAWNPVSPFLASASDDKTVRLWDMVTGDALVECRGHDSFVFCVDQYQHMIVSGSFDETVKLWDIRSGDCVSTLPAHSDPVTSVSFNRDGTVVCTASHDGLIRLWDVASGECLKTIYAAGNPPVCSAKFSPNSKYILASTLMDSILRLWPVHRTGSNLCAKSYQSEHHVNHKYSIVADFTFDGNIITGSETGKVILYDLQSQAVLQVLDCHESAVLAVSAHDRLPLLASGAMMNDRRVHFWAPKSFSF